MSPNWSFVTDPAFVSVSDGPGTSCVRPGCTHSHLADGRVICWRPPLSGLGLAASSTAAGTGHYAVDAEIASQPLPDRMASDWQDSAMNFWIAWTRAEVAAKLANVPIVLWLRDNHLANPGDAATTITTKGDPPLTCHLLSVQREDLIVTFGVVSAHPGSTSPVGDTDSRLVKGLSWLSLFN